MASPTPNDAMAYAKRLMGSMPIDDSTVKYRILDDAHRKLWMAAPWQWTVGMLDIVPLVNDQQSAFTNTRSDFLCLLHCYITNGQEKKDLQISSILPVATSPKGIPSQVMAVDLLTQSPPPIIPTAALRFFPVPSGYPSSNMPTVGSVYKKRSTAIDSGNAGTAYSTTSGVYDDWFWVYQEIVLLKAYQFTRDPRLGSVTLAANGVQYTGQYAAVEDGIRQMKASEEKFFKTLGEAVT